MPVEFAVASAHGNDAESAAVIGPRLAGFAVYATHFVAFIDHHPPHDIQ